MTSGRFFAAEPTALFRTRHRPCERGSRYDSRDKRKSNRLNLYYGQPGRLAYVVRDAVFGHSLSIDEEVGGAAEETRREIVLFQLSHSNMWGRCTDPLFIQPCIRSATMTKLKKAPQPGMTAGTLWRLRRPNGPANCVLSGATLPPIARPRLICRYSRILALLHPQKCVARINSLHADRLPTWLSGGQHDFTQARTKLVFSR
jgi:hypothetical protein